MVFDSYLFILKRLNDHGYAAYFVGGCVRDFFLGNRITDVDIATSASQLRVQQLFSDSDIDLSSSYFGVVTLRKPVICQITTFRIESDYHRHRYPKKITFTEEVTLDAMRRDFTVNALYMDKNMDLFDPYDGLTDLKNCVLRCIGEPKLRLNEDALRILRAIRFSITLEFTLEDNLLNACIDLSDTLSFLKKNAIELERTKLFAKVLTDSQNEALEYYRKIIPTLSKYF
jgi:tRNA nucleotidyltransferase (CCA-adding enzyme)